MCESHRFMPVVSTRLGKHTKSSYKALYYRPQRSDGLTSEERKEARYIRRKAKRLEKRRAALSRYDSLENVAKVSSLVAAYKSARHGVNWKASVQRYGMNLLKNVTATHKDILAGKDVRKGFVEFDIVERGKPRHISSVHVSERVAQRSLCANALIPVLSHSLVYDNGASVKGKGISFAMNRLTAHLHRHYRKYGQEGYVLSIDFKNYFGNINHKYVEYILRKNFTDKKLIDFAMLFVDAFGNKGLGLGSETSQILAVAYPNRIDHAIKEKMRIKGYGRYMDDLYLIHPSKAYLQKCLKILSKAFAQLGIVVNEKKTHIIKLSHGFTFLKTQFILTATGKVIRKPCRASITRQRRKLKKFRKFLDNGEMTFRQIYNAYMSWRGFILHKDAYRTVKNMDALFSELFLGERWWKECHEQEKILREKSADTKSIYATPTM